MDLYQKPIQLTSKLDMALETVIYGLLLFMPLAFGVVHAWSEEIVLLAVAALLVLYAAGAYYASGSLRWSWVFLPIVLFLLVPMVQLMPLPVDVVRVLSPNTYEVKSDLLTNLPVHRDHSSQSAVQPSEHNHSVQDSTLTTNSMTLSFYPHATWRGFRRVLAAVGFFFVILQYYIRPDRIKRLLTCITIVGAAVAVLAILQITTRTDKLYWAISTGRGFATGGPFMNRNNFAQFMNLSVGGAIALILVLLHEAFRGKPVTVAESLDVLSSTLGKCLWLLAAMVIVSFASVFLSLSRGGMIASLIAIAVTALVLTTRGSLRGRGWIIAAMALGAFVVVLYLGFDAVYDRLATLEDFKRAEGGRIQIVKDIATAWTQFPLFGTGLNTHNYVYPMFDRATIPNLAGHAENEFAQLAEETGLAGLVPMLILGLLISLAYHKCIRTANMPLCSAAYGLGFGLLAVLIHSLSDFGQQLPANALLSAAFCALLINLAHYKTHAAQQMPERQSRAICPVPGTKPPINVFAIPTTLVAAMLWLVFSIGGAADARRAEQHWKTVNRIDQHLSSIGWQAGNDQFADLIRSAQSAADLQPTDVYYRHWLNVYRWRSISRNIDADGNMILSAQAMGHVRRLVDEFADAIRLCPTHGQSWAMAGQLLCFVYDPPAGPETDADTHELQINNYRSIGTRMIRAGFQLAPSDPTVCFVNGILDVAIFQQNPEDLKLARDQYPLSSIKHPSFLAHLQNDTAPGYFFFHRAIALDGSFFQQAAAVYLNQLDHPHLAIALAGDDINRLNQLARLLTDADQHSAQADHARQRLKELLAAQADASDASPGTLASLARLCVQEGRHDEAAALYTRALAADYGNVNWRLNLARSLAQLNHTEQAMHECRIILRLQPNHTAARRLLEELAVRPEAQPPTSQTDN